MNQLQQAQLEMEPLLLAVVQIVKGPQNNLQIPRQLFFAEQQSRACGAGTLIPGYLQQFSLLAAQLGHKSVAQIPDHLPGKGRRAVSRIDQQI